MTGAPARLSAILPAILGYRIAELTVQHLVRQSIADKIELVIVAVDGDDSVPDSIPGLHSIKVARVPGIVSLGKVYAAGVRDASADVVVFCEDHSFPQPRWAEILVSEHEHNNVTAVGPRVGFGNVSRAIAWPDYLLGYGEWLADESRGQKPILPGHNSSYKRAALQVADLEHLLESETVLHTRLTAAGHTLIIQPEAVTMHYNYSRLGAWVKIVFNVGRSFAARRHTRRSLHLVYFVASPLIPLVRLSKILGHIRGRRNWRWTFLTFPVLLFGLAIDCCGQATGHLLGPGNLADSTISAELNRFEYLSSVDKRSFLNEKGTA